MRTGGRITKFAVAAVTTMVLSQPVLADDPLDVQKCSDWNGAQFSPDVRIGSCSSLIQSGRYRGKDLAAPFFSRGLAYSRKGQYDLAIRDYGEATRLDPRNANAFLYRGIAYANKGQFDRAGRDYDAAIRLDPKNAVAFNNRGVSYAERGQYDRAIRDYDQAIRLKPDYAYAYNNRGYTYAAKGQNDRAIQDYDQAAKLKADYPLVFINRAGAYITKDQYDRAIRDYDVAIKLNPKDTQALKGRGRANFFAGALPKALADFKQASEIRPQDAYAALWLDIVTRRSKLPRHLGQAASQIDMKKWPGPVVRLYLGQQALAAVLAAASNPDPMTKRNQVCEANFYGGELALAQGARNEATRLLRLAAKDCPKTFVEYDGAVAELKSLKR